MSPVAGNHQDLDRAVSLFRVLAQQARLVICLELAQEERRVIDLVETLALAQSTVSGHLAALRACGLVVGRRNGRHVVYSLTHRELLDLLTSTERLLELLDGPAGLRPVRATRKDG